MSSRNPSSYTATVQLCDCRLSRCSAGRLGLGVVVAKEPPIHSLVCCPEAARVASERKQRCVPIDYGVVFYKHVAGAANVGRLEVGMGLLRLIQCKEAVDIAGTLY